MEKTKLKKKSLTTLTINQIEENINAKHIKIGDRIPTEVELIEEFGVSRNTIREAISALEEMGVLEVRQGKGTFVLAKNRYQALMKKTLAKENKDNLFMSYKAIKASIIITALSNCNDEDINTLSSCLEQADEYYKHKKIKELDYKFNMALAEASHINFQKNLFKCFYETIKYNNEKTIYENFKSIYVDIVKILKDHNFDLFNNLIFNNL